MFYEYLSLFLGFIKIYFFKLLYIKRIKFDGKPKMNYSFKIAIKNGSKLILGKNFRSRNNVSFRIYNNGIVNIGENVFLNDGCSINCQKNIEIGNNVMFGQNVMLFDHDHDYKNNINNFVRNDIKIGNNVWIGANCIILKGVTIEDNTVIAAGTVVNKNICGNKLIYTKREIRENCMNKENYKYSIIVPAYNVENYLERCINSVTEQKYNNYEIIIVDDGSTDQTGDICDNIAKKNDNIKIIHKSNGGLSSARNEGIKVASGDYLIFLDSDDFWVENDFLVNINAIMNNEDVIIFNSFKYFDENSKIKARFKLSNNFNNLNHNEKIKYIIENNIYKACAWDKIIKASILKDNDMLFPEGVLSEDMEWCGMLLDKSEKISVYPNVVYAYRQRNNSISKSVSKKHLIDIYNQIYEGTKTKNQYVLNYFAFEYLILYSHAFVLKDKEIIKKAKNLSWILSYNISHKVKKIKKIYDIFGYTMCGKILEKYLRWK